MKSKYLIILAAAASMFTSCDMDLSPVGQLDDQTAIQTLNDAQRFRNGLYSNSRSFNTSGFFTIPELQADMFNGLVINGNRNGPIANGDVVPSNDEITAYWSLLFANIANCNYYLEVMPPLIEKAEADNDEITLAKYKRFVGEAHFFRGYYYAMMFDRFCTIYSESKGDTEGLGLPIVTKWAPTSNRDTYPGRSSMNVTLKFIDDELQAALTAISEFEETGGELDTTNASDISEILAPNSPYISSWGVRAIQARIALWTGKYQQALDLAQSIINCGIYTLATASNYLTMWTRDSSTEVIYRPYMSSNELSNSIGGTWLGTESTQADYIPASEVIADYKSMGMSGVGAARRYKDVRYSSFVEERTLQSAFGDIATPCFVKFPGNPDLQRSSQVNLMNMPKTLRLSEMYFIAMESAMELGQEDVAKELLNTYMTNRMSDGKVPADATSATGADLVEYIRTQRGLEFIGEGFRISDLRRWHKGFNRASGAEYENSAISPLITAAGLNVVYTSDDPRYTWPIPNDELVVNPQMAGQQNPGY